MNLRFWKLKGPQVIEVVRRSSVKLRLAEWRSDPNLVNDAARIVGSESFQCMLDVLKNESPANLCLPLDATMEARSNLQCRIEGYAMALANIEAMAKVQKQYDTLVPEFAPEEPPEQQTA